MAHPSFSSTAVKVDIGRASLFAIVLSVVLFALLTTGSVYAALDTQETMVTVVG